MAHWAIALLQGGDVTGLSPVGYGWSLVKMVAALAIVCVTAYLALRYGLRYLAPKGPQQLLRVVEQCPLATNRSVWLVEAAGRYFLLGSAEGGVSMLAELDQQQLDDHGKEKGKGFSALLRRRPKRAVQGRDESFNDNLDSLTDDAEGLS